MFIVYLFIIKLLARKGIFKYSNIYKDFYKCQCYLELLNSFSKMSKKTVFSFHTVSEHTEKKFAQDYI